MWSLVSEDGYYRTYESEEEMLSALSLRSDLETVGICRSRKVPTASRKKFVERALTMARERAEYNSMMKARFAEAAEARADLKDLVITMNTLSALGLPQHVDLGEHERDLERKFRKALDAVWEKASLGARGNFAGKEAWQELWWQSPVGSLTYHAFVFPEDWIVECAND